MTQRKDRIDAAGAMILVGFSALLGLNQVLIKLVNAGMSPIFQAGFRSLAAFLPVLVIAWWRGSKLSIRDGSFWPGILCGLFFSFEFILLFQSLEWTSVSRASVLFYTMPFWMAVGAHFLIPGEALNLRRLGGLAVAIAGVAFALLRNDHPASEHAFAGDLLALFAAAGWAAVGLTARLTALNRSSPAMQLVYQLVVSAIVLLPLALLLAPAFRTMTPSLWAIFAFQSVGVVAIGFMVWFSVLAIYPASDMASFAFLAPVFGVFFGWAILGETVGVNLILALVLVAVGILLVTRKPKSPVVARAQIPPA
jgi:drug/metabolite transporter (DMT)-like permease